MGKKKSKKTVEIGTTVELDVINNSVKENSKKMGKKSKKDAKGANVELIAAIANPKAKKAELQEIVKDNKMFAKSKDELLEVKSVFSLKSDMLAYFDEEQVKEIKAAMPKPERKKKEVKVDPVVEEIVSAKKVKQLKKIAKANPEMFAWKKLKKLEFEEMKEDMLGAEKPKAKAEPTMIPNPLYAEIDAFEKKKKLKAWAKEHEEFASLKLKKLELEDMQEALKGAVPAEIEKKPMVRTKKESTTGKYATQSDCIRSLIKKDIKRKKLLKVLAGEYDQSIGWATSRMKTYEGAYGENGKNDGKLK